MASLGKNWKGHFPGNYSGNLWASYNIDLEKYPGRMVLSDKFRRIASGLGRPYKFMRTDATATDQWFAIVYDTDILRNGSSTITAGTWVTDDTTGTFNDPKDMVIHESANGEQRLLCSRDTDIAILNSTGSANVWDDNWYTAVLSATALTSGHHPMARVQRLVAVADKVSGKAVIHTIDKDDVVSESRLVFPAGYTVRTSYGTSNRFWFGLDSDTDGHAKIIEWDGSSTSYNNEYDLIGSFALNGFMVSDIPYWIDEKGYIYRYTGGGFDVVQSFSLDEDRMVLGTAIASAEYTILPYGSFVDGHIVYLNVGLPMVNSTGDADTLPGGTRRGRSGVWVYNTRNNNLYHHMAYGEHASAGTDVNYGNAYLDLPGAVLKAKVGDNKILIAGGQVFTGGATWLASTQSGIYRQIETTDRSSNAGRNRGYFVTPYLPIQDVEAMWEALWVKFKELVGSDDKIIVKWRAEEPLYNASAQDPNANPLRLMNAQGTWVNTTSFTCKVPTGVAVGDEVEIFTGDNAGCSFNISALSATPDSSTSITVTIDEAAPTSSTDTFLCRFDNWNTETAITATDIGSKKVPFTQTAHGEYIQLKIEMRGFDIQIDELFPAFKSLTNQKQS